MRKRLLAAVAASLLAASGAAASGPPHTTAKLFHPNVKQMETYIEDYAATHQILGKNGLEVAAKCRAYAPAINSTGLGYRHVRCNIAGPAPISVRGFAVFSIKNGQAVYVGRFCALGVCQPWRGVAA